MKRTASGLIFYIGGCSNAPEFVRDCGSKATFATVSVFAMLRGRAGGVIRPTRISHPTHTDFARVAAQQKVADQKAANDAALELPDKLSSLTRVHAQDLAEEKPAHLESPTRDRWLKHAVEINNSGVGQPLLIAKYRSPRGFPSELPSDSLVLGNDARELVDKLALRPLNKPYANLQRTPRRQWASNAGFHPRHIALPVADASWASGSPRGRPTLAAIPPAATKELDHAARLLRASGLTTSGAAAAAATAALGSPRPANYNPYQGGTLHLQLKERPKKDKLPPDSPLMGTRSAGKK